MVQFQVSRLFGLHVQVQGMFIVDEQGIRLAFNRPSDKDENLLDADVEAVQIRWSDVQSLEFVYGLMHDSVRLSVHSVAVLGSLPGVKEQEAELQVERRHREALQAVERRVQEYRSGQREDNVEELLDDVRDFLDDL